MKELQSVPPCYLSVAACMKLQQTELSCDLQVLWKCLSRPRPLGYPSWRQTAIGWLSMGSSPWELLSTLLGNSS